MNLISQTGQEISPFKAPEIVFLLHDVARASSLVLCVQAFAPGEAVVAINTFPTQEGQECALPYGLRRRNEHTPGNFYINFAHAKHASIIN